jgi:hypothetical protein
VAILLTQQKVGLATTPTLGLVTILTNPPPHPNTPEGNNILHLFSILSSLFMVYAPLDRKS